jgi:hypothetical protein
MPPRRLTAHTLKDTYHTHLTMFELEIMENLIYTSIYIYIYTHTHTICLNQRRGGCDFNCLLRPSVRTGSKRGPGEKSVRLKRTKTDFLFSESHTCCATIQTFSCRETQEHWRGEGERKRKTAIFCSFPPIPSSDPALRAPSRTNRLSLYGHELPPPKGRAQRERERNKHFSVLILCSYNTF